MHILMAIVAILGGAAFWWWRIKAMKETADEITDVAGTAWGKYKRYKFKKKADSSAVEAVEDPIAAAAIMMIAIIQEEHDLTAKGEAAIERELKTSINLENPQEVMVFAKWVAKHVEDANNVSLRYSKLWGRALNQEELRQFVEMVRRTASAEGPVTDRQLQKISKLEQRLGLS